MTDDQGRDQLLKALLRRLVTETGITEDEPAGLILMLGTDWYSLRRGAFVIKARSQQR